MQRVATVAITVLLLTASVASAAAVAAPSNGATVSSNGTAQTDAYAGTHVSFEQSGTAMTNYSVDGTELFTSAETQSQSEYEAQSDVDAGLSLSAVTDVAGGALSLDTSTETRAEITSESGATMTAHDSERGILTVNAGEESQYAEFELAGDAEASAESDDRVVVESGERTGAFVVVGDGEVAVNDDGNVSADLGSDSTLVFRSYEGERDEADEQQEQLIAEGTATAEVYVTEEGGEQVTDAATYGQDVAVETQSQTESQIDMTVERSTSEGTVVITSVSEGAIATAESADDVDVTIDGEAAAQASSYSELKGGIGEEPRYMVQQSSSASAAADVLVAVDHFSERNVTVESSGEASGSDGGNSSDGSDDGTGSGMPGFGAVAALTALLSAIGLRIRD